MNCYKRRKKEENKKTRSNYVPSTNPEAPPTIDSLLLRLEKCTRLIVVLTPGWLLFGEELGPSFFGDDGVVNV